MSNFVRSPRIRRVHIGLSICLLGISGLFMRHSFAGTTKSDTLSTVLELRKKSFATIRAYGTQIMIVNKSTDLRNSVREEIHRDELAIPSQLTEDSWMARGKEQRGERLQITPLDSKEKLHIISYTDGHKTQIWNWGWPSAQVQDADSVVQSLSETLQIESHGNATSPELDPLIAGTAKSLGDEKLGTVETQKFEQKVGDEIHTWWVAPRFGSVIVKYERRNAAPQNGLSVVSWKVITVVDKVEQTGGLWMPRLTRSFNLVAMDNGKTFWETWIEAKISRVEVNTPAPSPYQIQFPLQTYIPQKSTTDMRPIGGDISDELPRFGSYAEKADLPAECFSEIPLSLQKAED